MLATSGWSPRQESTHRSLQGLVALLPILALHSCRTYWALTSCQTLLWMLKGSTDTAHHTTLQSSEFSDHLGGEGDTRSVGDHLRFVIIFKSRLKYKTQIYGLLSEAENTDEENVKSTTLLNRGYYPQSWLMETSILVSVLGHKDRIVQDTWGQRGENVPSAGHTKDGGRQEEHIRKESNSLDDVNHKYRSTRWPRGPGRAYGIRDSWVTKQFKQEGNQLKGIFRKWNWWQWAGWD